MCRRGWNFFGEQNCGMQQDRRDGDGQLDAQHDRSLNTVVEYQSGTMADSVGYAVFAR
jgi:hypothetical protein